MKIFVGNVSFDANGADVKKLFGSFGKVASVAIVMDKKGMHSRGFGFVDMPDDRQAKAAIAVLNSKEFMGRPLNVEATRPKPEDDPASRKNREDGTIGSAQARTTFKKGGRYKQGRRSRSFMKRRAAAGIEEPVIKRKVHENPMRWRKKPRQRRNALGAPKPWEKTESASGPREKVVEQPRPWQKKTARRQRTRFKNRKKSDGFKK